MDLNHHLPLKQAALSPLVFKATETSCTRESVPPLVKDGNPFCQPCGTALLAQADRYNLVTTPSSNGSCNLQDIAVPGCH